MIRVKTGDIYYNTQVYFARNIIPNLPNDDKVWMEQYRIWLAEQGARIEKSPDKLLLRNSLDVAPGYDQLVFDDELDATVFVLRWA
jgi:hypothetical protein